MTDQLAFEAGDTFALTATVDQSLEDTSSTLTITDVTTSTDVKQCTTGTVCEVDLGFAAGEPREYIARVDALSSNEVTVARAPWNVELSADKTELSAGEEATLTATLDQDLTATAGAYAVAIFDTTNEVRVSTCTSGTSCQVVVSAYDHPVPTSEYVAVVLDASDVDSETVFEAVDVQATSAAVSVSREAWEVVLTADSEVLNPAGSTHLRAELNQDVGETNGLYAVYIFEVSKDIFVAQCNSGTECVSSVGWNTTDPWPGFYEAVVAKRRSSAPTSYYELEDRIDSLSEPASINEAEWEASLATDKTVLKAGETATLTASSNFDVGDTEGRYALYIVDRTAHRILASCATGTSCQANFAYYDQYDNASNFSHVFSVIIGRPGAVTEGEITDWKTWSGDQLWIERNPWQSQLLRTGGSTLTLTANQDVGILNGWGWFLFRYGPDGFMRVDECFTGKRCVMTGAPLVDGGYVAFLARDNNPTSMSDIAGYIEAASVWQPNANNLGPSLTSPFSGRGETTGGGNPGQDPCFACHADPINTATGEFFLLEIDLSLPGAGPAFQISRTYSTDGAEAFGPFGHGWAATLSGRLRVLVATDDSNPLPRQVEIEQENGSILVFTRAEASSDFVAPERVLASLSWDDTSDQWTLVRRQQQILRFDSDGNLTSLEDRDGNAVAFTYAADKLHTITASGGRAFTLTWTGDLITEITDSAGRTIEYTYDTDSNLTSVLNADGATTSYEYNSAHLMTALVRPGGGRTENDYDSEGRAILQTDPIGRETSFGYNWDGTTTTLPDGTEIVEQYSDGMLLAQTRAYGTADAATTQYAYSERNLLASTIDPVGGLTSYGYDGDGRRTSQIDPLGNQSTWTYGAHPDPLTSTDAEGRTVTATYDAAGRPLTITSPEGNVETWTYNANGTKATYEDGNGAITTYTYDAAGQVASSTDDDNNITTFTYNAAGLLTSTTTPGGRTTTTAYDNAGRVVSVEDPNGAVTEYDYDAAGNLSEITNAEGEATAYTYDAAGQRLTITDANDAVTTLTYDLAGNIATRTDANGNTTTTAYDHYGNLARITDPLGRTTSSTYDLAGRLTATQRPSGATTSYLRDAAGRIVESTDPLGKVTSLEYDRVGQVISQEDPLGRITNTHYDEDGRVVQITLPDLSAKRFEYDNAGNLLSFENADELETSYTYTSTGLVETRTDPGGLVTEYEYDPDGKLEVVTRPDSTTVEYTYNDAGLLTAVDYPSSPGEGATHVYDDVGRLTELTDSTGTTTLTYDSTGRVASETDGSGDTITYTYDAGGRLLTIGYPAVGDVTYDYDDADQIVSVTDWSSRSTNFTWTLDGKLSTQETPNGIEQERLYDLAGRATSIVTSDATTALATFTYAHDDAGQLTQLRTEFDVGELTADYDHDLLGQLSGVSRDDGLANPTTVPVTASPGGLLTIGDDGAALTYNAAQQVVEREPLSGPPATYSYNANGARVEAEVASSPTTTTTYAYDAADRLSSVISGTTSVEYETDARGLRQTRDDGAVADFTWSTVRSIPLLISDGEYRYLYASSTTPFAQIEISTSELTYLHDDELGSVRLATDGAGGVLGAQSFTEFGTPVPAAGAIDSHVGFTGNWTDPDTGLVHLRARDYDPETGQFLNVDPALEDTRQPYAYAANNPVQLTDPMGLDPRPRDTAAPSSTGIAPTLTPAEIALLCGTAADGSFEAKGGSDSDIAQALADLAENYSVILGWTAVVLNGLGVIAGAGCALGPHACAGSLAVSLGLGVSAGALAGVSAILDCVPYGFDGRCIAGLIYADVAFASTVMVQPAPLGNGISLILGIAWMAGGRPQLR